MKKFIDLILVVFPIFLFVVIIIILFFYYKAKGIGKEVSIMTSDGTKIFLRQYNFFNRGYCDCGLRAMSNDYIDENFVTILCPTKKHILHTDIIISNNLFNSIKFEHYGDFKNVKAYNIILTDESVKRSYIFWIDCNQDKYCGSLFYPPMRINSAKDTIIERSYYDAMKDFYLYHFYETINSNKKLLEKGDTNTKIVPRFYDCFMVFDDRLGSKMKKDWQDIYSYRDRVKGINETKKLLEVVTLRDDTSKLKKNPNPSSMPTSPNQLKEDELRLPYDWFGVEIRREQTKKYTKATSAGPDKKFGTPDDMTYISKAKKI